MSNQEYSKLTHEQHVLKIPDTYIGDIETNNISTWFFSKEQNKMIHDELSYIPGEYKLFDELIVNSLDQYIRLSESTDKSIFYCKYRFISIFVYLNLPINLYLQ